MRLLFLFILLSSFLYSGKSVLNKSFIPSYDKVFLRVFKYEKELEIWISEKDSFFLYKKIPICKLSGKLGPKRKQGDFQVPEGFYYINEFNPHSKYKKSLGLNYPNESDKKISKFQNLGGSIYIHGNCVSVGCISIGDTNIEELYTICKKTNKKIQVHIFPIDFRKESSKNFIEILFRNNIDKMEFTKNLEEGFYFFEMNRKLFEVSVNEKGLYLYR